MPQTTRTTILGTQLNQSLGQNSVTLLALFFNVPFLESLRNRKVGTLRLKVLNATQDITVYKFDVFYPGIYPIYSISPVSTINLQAVFDCFRPGLSYTFFWQ